jgi:uncharacterized membrane protein YeaQ/YmgE (transglycosylase-associated protein family)
MSDFILWVIIGLIAGVLAMLVVFRTIPRDPWQWAGAIVTGLVGGVVGGWVTDALGVEATNWIGAIVIAALGAVGVLMLIQRMHPRSA